MTKKSTLIVGLPSSGKTTFLAATWAMLSSGRECGGWKIGSVSEGDRKHLNAIAQAWHSCQKLERTLPSAETTVDIPIIRVSDNTKFVLTFPDLDGESVRGAWANRGLTPLLKNAIDDSDHVLLFISTQKMKKALRLDQLPRLPSQKIQPTPSESTNLDKTQPNDLSASGNDSAPKTEPVKVTPWDPLESPTQVILVEMLQIIANEHRIKKMGIVLSAWDKVIASEGNNIAPRDWLKRELPMLQQYLDARQEIGETRVFGVSAQGGDYETAADRQRLLGASSPQRASVVGASGEKMSNLLETVGWLL